MKSYTYMGTADDVVRRYPWKNGWNIDSINHQLIHSVIYDKTLVINDGYLISNPELLNSLKNLNRSLLGNVLLSGTAILFCRSSPKNIAEGILKSREKLQTHRIALQDVDDKDFKRRMKTLQENLNNNPLQWPKDKNTGAIFALFLDKLNYKNSLDLTLPDKKSKEDFDKIYRSFSDEMDENYNEARQQWERICWREFGHLNLDEYDPFSSELRKMDCYPRVQTMMQVANEAYHVAYTSAMCWSLRNEEVGSRPLTAYCPAYLDIFKSIIIEKEKSLRFDKLGEVLISFDLIRFGENTDFSWIRDLVLNDEVVQVREDYLIKLNNYINWIGEFSDLKKIANEYRDILAKLVAESVPTYSDLAESIFNFFGGSQVVSVLQAADSLRKHAGIKTPVNLDPVKSVKDLIEVPEISLRLQNTGLKLQWYGKNKSLARDLGLINAELDTKKVEELLEPIKPYISNSNRA